MCGLQQQADIILVTESWCSEEISDAYLTIDGYDLQQDLRLDRKDTAQGRGGGLLVYVKSGLTIFKIDNLVDFNQYCTLKVRDVTIYLVYRSPNAPPEALEKLCEIVKSAPPKQPTDRGLQFTGHQLDVSRDQQAEQGLPGGRAGRHDGAAGGVPHTGEREYP